MFNKSLGIDLEEKGAAEGIHIANCGGIWQGVVMGFGGLRSSLESEELSIESHLPDEITHLTFKAFFKGDWYNVYIDHNKCLTEKISDNTKACK